MIHGSRAVEAGKESTEAESEMFGGDSGALVLENKICT